MKILENDISLFFGITRRVDTLVSQVTVNLGGIMTSFLSLVELETQ